MVAGRFILVRMTATASPAIDVAAQACQHLLDGTGLGPPDLLATATATAAKHADFADLYLEKTISEAWILDEGRIDSGSYSMGQGMSLRSVCGDASVFASADLINPDTVKRLRATVQPGTQFMTQGRAKVHLPAPTDTKIPPRYHPGSPLVLADTTKLRMLRIIEDHARATEPRIHNVTAQLAFGHKTMLVARSDGTWHADLRPMFNVRVSVVLIDGGKVETGTDGIGGRSTTEHLTDANLTALADEAIRKASQKLMAGKAPAGMMPVVLGNGWSGILLHEAIGHGLEGDFNRKGQSAFSGRIGERISPPGITVVDDGTLFGRRGSISCDDEGTQSACNTLIEDGILRNYMQDLVNSSLMGVAPTGNGRRESYKHEPMPRMTNTYMLNGKHTPEEIIASVNKGLYCKSFRGGSVDITNGNFNFYVEEAYVIEGGKLGRCVKGATIIGNGPEAMTKMSMVANDMDLDPGVGTCGKNGQWVPVGVGQPHCKIDEMLVGGTEI